MKNKDLLWSLSMKLKDIEYFEVVLALYTISHYKIELAF